ncbi:LamG domain-containing protein [Phytohabitans kaempferiae]|uniref:LamG domain-containing protein n=1 Tax=Phytohabitans kaempferiae TaxID=1620943 RepID=A0ABV6M4X8_9ACTN
MSGKTLWHSLASVLLLTAVLAVPAHDAVPVATATGTALSPELAALTLARQSGRAVEVAELTTEQRRVVAQPDGMLRAELSVGPQRVKRGGAWRPVDATLVRHLDGTVGPAAAVVDMRFSGGGSEPLVRMTHGADWFGLHWPGPLPAPVLRGESAVYVDVLPGVDLVMRAEAEGYGQFLVVRTRAASRHPALGALRFALSGRGLVPSVEDGALAVRDGAGEVAFSGARPLMWDSTGATLDGSRTEQAAVLTERPATARSAEVSLSMSDGVLTVAPDRAMLDDPATVYPVVIDPPLSRNRAYWTMVWSNGQEFPNHATEHARVGYDGWSGQAKVSRAFYRFDTSPLVGKVIRSAIFAHKQIHSPNHNCNATSYGPGVQLGRTGAISASTVWPGPSWLSTLSTNTMVHGHSSSCPGWDRNEWTATAAVTAAAAEGATTLTLGLRSANESDRDGWRQYDNDASYPVLTVDYNTVPAVPANLRTTSPATACVRGSARPFIPNDAPIFWARLADADSAVQNVRAQFEYGLVGAATPLGTITTAYAGAGDFSAQAPALAEGTYTWRARASDSISWSGYSAACEFTVDATAPRATPVVSSAQFPENAWAETGVGVAGTVTIDANVDTDVASYEYAFNTTVFTSAGAPASLSGPVTLTLTPRTFGPQVLHARSVDRAGNRGPVRSYFFKIPAAAPVGGYRMDEGSGTTSADWSGRDRYLTLPASGVTWTQGKTGTAGDHGLRFDGTSSVTATVGMFRTDSSYTVMGWVKLDNASGNRALLSQDGAHSAGFTLGTRSGQWAATFLPTDATEAPTHTIVAAPGTAATGVWTHLALVHDRSLNQMRLYVNGAVAATASVTIGWHAPGQFRIGQMKYLDTFYSPLIGQVDEVRAYAGAMDDGQIYTAYLEPRP